MNYFSSTNESGSSKDDDFVRVHDSPSLYAEGGDSEEEKLGVPAAHEDHKDSDSKSARSNNSHGINGCDLDLKKAGSMVIEGKN